MGRVIIALIVGVLIGGALVYFTFVGVPHSEQRPGELVKAPDASGAPAGTAQVVIRQDLLNAALGSIFHNLKPPTFPIGSADANCASSITILPPGSRLARACGGITQVASYSSMISGPGRGVELRSRRSMTGVFIEPCSLPK